MTPERWRRVGELFQSALDRDEESRDAFLAAACGSDENLRGGGPVPPGRARRGGHPRRSPGRGSGDDGRRRRRADAAGGARGSALRGGGPHRERRHGRGLPGARHAARADVAVKVLPAAPLGDAMRLRRFAQEARAAGALNHPNILTVYDVGRRARSPYVVSELLEGETLRARIGRGGALPREEALDSRSQVAAVSWPRTSSGIVHRDLKPANLFLTRDGRVKILDFGLAKRVAWSTDHATSPTQPGMLMGTARLHVAGAGPRRGDRSRLRRVLLRRRPLRDALRPARVRGAFTAGDADRGPGHGARLRAAARRRRRAGRRRPALPGQGPVAAIRGRSPAASGPGRLRHADLTDGGNASGGGSPGGDGRRSALPRPGRGPSPGLPGRRPRGGADPRAGLGGRPEGGGAQLELPVQAGDGRRAADRRASGRRPHRGGQRAPHRQPPAHHRPARRCRGGLSRLVGTVRP